MKALTVIRVSSEDQKKGYGPEDQWEEDVVVNAPKLGVEVSEELKRSIEEPATHWEREKFTKVIKEAIELYQKGAIGAVIFPRVDRETRFVFSSMPLLSEMLKIGIKVFFARELLYLDPRDPEAVERYLDKVSQSQAYIETMRLNTMRGRRRRARKDGLLTTGGGGLYGYIYDKATGKRLRNEYEVSVIHKMVDWVLNEHLFLNEVCRRLMAENIPAPKGGKKWSRATVGRILTNEAHTGETYAYTMVGVEPRQRNKERPGKGKTSRKLLPKEEWIRLPDDTTPRIITPQEFEALQRQLERNRELSPRNQKFEYLLRGHVHCQECGRKYYGTPDRKSRYYRCSGRSSVLAFEEVCHNRRVNANELERQVWGTVVDTIMRPERFLQAYKSRDTEGYTQGLRQRLENCKDKLQMLDNAETKLIRVFQFTPMSDAKLKAELEWNQIQRKKVEREVAKVEKSIREYKDVEITEEQIRAVSDYLRALLKEGKLSFGAKRRLFEDLRMKVWISQDFHAIELGITPIPDTNTVSTHC